MEIRSRYPGHAHLRVILMFVRMKGQSFISLPNLKRTKVIKGSQNFEIGSRDLGHAHLGVVLWSVRREGPSSMSVPNFMQVALFLP